MLDHGAHGSIATSEMQLMEANGELRGVRRALGADSDSI